MAKQTINIGTAVNDGTGDPLRIAFDKINDNFDELYLTDSDIAGDDTQVLFNDSEAFGADADFTYNKTTNALNVAGNVTGGNLVTGAQVVATGNVTGGNLITAGLVSATGNVSGGNIAGTRGVFTNVAGTLETATQTNITSVGTLTALTATGNITGGNLSGTSITGTLTTATQTNITSVGTLTALTATGNITGGNLTTGAQVVATGNITGGNLNTSGNVAGLYIKGDGSELTGITASATAAGADTQVQFNDGGTATGGDAGFTYNKTTDAVTVVGNINGGNLVTGGSLSLGGTVVTATAAELNKLDGVTATTTELNYVSGVSSAIQTQLNAKAPTASPTFTGTPAAPTAAVNTNTTQIATTAYVVAQIADDAPTKTGTGASGTWGISITGTAALATSVTATANNATNETVYLTFVDGATGTQGIETDTNLTYNPSTNVLSTTASQAQYADLAEMYSSDQEYEPGTVVVLGGESEVTHSTRSHDTAVAGVVSTAPAYLMNSSLEGVPVALQGRVPCKVLGPVRKGDLLVTSQHDGVAQRMNDGLYKPGCVLGKAIESIQDPEIKVIEILVGRL